MLRALQDATQETLLTTPAEESEKWIRVKQSTSQKFAQEAEDATAKVVLPAEYKEFAKPDFKPMHKPHYEMGFEEEERTNKWIQ
ncbi:hypothetical protein M378DRAFT_18379 [Amanita muscaria Koide BX008]|uniref:Uncharacterized protein n=1 Tax=Amanita muscaria (strain Koide BX008) TaxID=946122 RepID=A0A0C2RXC4_AMAMK|nr:hypothetical protein M378DRAFT_18379 [Amanita muscaria Koide BX008]